MAKMFKLPQHKRFNYTPRFYNERDEQRKQRFSRISRQVTLESRDGQMVTDDRYIKFARKTKKKSNITMLVVLVLLLMMYYFFVVR
jgi:hypothetical protein